MLSVSTFSHIKSSTTTGTHPMFWTKNNLKIVTPLGLVLPNPAGKSLFLLRMFLQNKIKKGQEPKQNPKGSLFSRVIQRFFFILQWKKGLKKNVQIFYGISLWILKNAFVCSCSHDVIENTVLCIGLYAFSLFFENTKKVYN